MKRQSGFAALEALLILIIIAIIGGTGYYVWHSKNQTDKILNSTTNTSSSRTATKSTVAEPPADPYKGWSTYTTKGEKISFRYPENWSLSDTSLSSRDIVSLSDGSGATVFINAGAVPGDDTSASTKANTQNVIFLGQPSELIFWTSPGQTDTSEASEVDLASSQHTKNIELPSEGQSDQGNFDIALDFGDNSDGSPISESVNTIKESSSYRNFVKLVESIKY
ncbi:MAG TPA: hypothetical protein VFP35_03265 [Candidatus Saccharimonadales bacterium]|nr:hypothetical protein [Candidatus Saccharimonadales bacterium]